MNMNLFSIYVHWPFCSFKCPYCDFNSYTSYKFINEQEWIDAYISELTRILPTISYKKLVSIFFGGGTPSLMNPESIKHIIDFICNFLNTNKDDLEVTLEANPTSLETRNFQDFYESGINRLSIGVQSFNDQNLKFLGRKYNSYGVIKSINKAKDVFNNISLDLIYGVINQTEIMWKDELRKVLEFSPHHLSIYQLTIEQGTSFYKEFLKGSICLPSEDFMDRFYEITKEELFKFNFVQYEVSNYAVQNKYSRHNLNYWNYGDYIGIGPGAHSRLTSKNGEKIAISQIKLPRLWLKRIKLNNNGDEFIEKLTYQQQLTEIFLMGLRLNKGINLDNLNNDIFEIIDKKSFIWLKKNFFLEENEGFLRATNKGMKCLNTILRKLLL